MNYKRILKNTIRYFMMLIIAIIFLFLILWPLAVFAPPPSPLWVVIFTILAIVHGFIAIVAIFVFLFDRALRLFGTISNYLDEKL